ncbi:unnamed protein product [Clonostachys chloroleuca]|uniref:3'-5' exonuclease domain-containing protein n=1 Tax=Clonostachys chloroleuca TaxID=1926264 RepID=A0AA35LZR6_9HYPO|nr:unnamed protein product [Clonostachys chloroleuca]
MSSSTEIKPVTSNAEVVDLLASLLDRTTINADEPTATKSKPLESKSLGSKHTFVDTQEVLSDAIDGLVDLPSSPPSLYVDLEGINLSRHGTISILQIHVRTTGHTYLIDVLTLGSLAFSTSGILHTETTLKSILESDQIPKVFFDVRNDSDALYSHYNISLSGIHDLQLMALATRNPGQRRVISGLAKCIEKDAPLSSVERSRLAAIKAKGSALFSPEKGGSYAVFDARPLSGEILDYCVQDTTILPRLWSHYDRQLSRAWDERVRDMSRRRVKESQSPAFNGKGQHMALGPVEWARLRK